MIPSDGSETARSGASTDSTKPQSPPPASSEVTADAKSAAPPDSAPDAEAKVKPKKAARAKAKSDAKSDSETPGDAKAKKRDRQRNYDLTAIKSSVKSAIASASGHTGANVVQCVTDVQTRISGLDSLRGMLTTATTEQTEAEKALVPLNAVAEHVAKLVSGALKATPEGTVLAAGCTTRAPDVTAHNLLSRVPAKGTDVPSGWLQDLKAASDAVDVGVKRVSDAKLAKVTTEVRFMVAKRGVAKAVQQLHAAVRLSKIAQEQIAAPELPAGVSS